MNSEALTDLAQAKFKLGEKDFARQAWDKVLSLDPSDGITRRNIHALSQVEDER